MPFPRQGGPELYKNGQIKLNTNKPLSRHAFIFSLLLDMTRPAALSSYLDFSAVIDWTVSWDFKSNKLSLKLSFEGVGGVSGYFMTATEMKLEHKDSSQKSAPHNHRARRRQPRKTDEPQSHHFSQMP